MKTRFITVSLIVLNIQAHPNIGLIIIIIITILVTVCYNNVLFISRTDFMFYFTNSFQNKGLT